MEYRCEYLIVGGGLAGCSLGYLLRKSGADVLILERLDAKKKDKLCAGLTAEYGKEEFISIFGEPVWESLAPFSSFGLIEQFGGNEICWTGNFFEMPRKVMDDAALQCYLGSGGRLIDHATVRTIDTDAGKARCINLNSRQEFDVSFSKIIGADGALSTVRRLLTGKKPDCAFAVESDAPFCGDKGILSYLPHSVGYNWYLPRGKDATVGCICLHHAGYGSKEITSVCLKEMEDFCRNMGITPTGKIRGAFLPTGLDVLLRSGKRSYFVGDAAGLISNITGAGIQYALLSSRLLAEAFLGGTPYEEAMRLITETVLKMAKNAKTIQFLECFTILAKGTPCSVNSQRL